MLESKKTMREINNSPGFIINEGLNAKEYEVTVKYIRNQWINTIRRCNDGLARYVVENDLQIFAEFKYLGKYQYVYSTRGGIE